MAKMSKTQQAVNVTLGIDEEVPIIDNTMSFNSNEVEQNDNQINDKPLSYITNDKLDIANSKTPFFRVRQVPSLFATYPNNRIYVKSYSWGQIKVFNTSKLDTLATWDFILDGIYTDGFDKEELTLQDFFFLSTLRRLKTVGNTQFTVNSICNAKLEVKDDSGNLVNKVCGKVNSFLLSDNANCIGYEELKLKKGKLSEIKIKGQWERFSPLTVKDAKFLLSRNLLDNEIAVIAVQCRTKPFDDIFEIINSDDFDFEEGQYLDQLTEKFYHGLEPVQRDSLGKPLACKECGNKMKISLDGGGIIIQPFRESQSEKDRVRFNDEG